MGYYKHASSTKPIEPKDSEVRIYKSSALAVSAPSGKKFKKIVISTPGTGSGQYCVSMTGLEGGGNGTADQSALTVTWTGSASKVVLQANEAQVRMEKLTVEFE